MARQHDRRGLAVTATSREAALHFDAAVDALLGHRADCAMRLAEALAADPDFLLAHCLKGFACKFLARRELDNEAGDVLTAAIAHEPHDLLALKLHHALHFMLGDRRAMLGTIRHAIGAWYDGLAGFGYALGCLAFALEETGAYAEAERVGRRACALTPSDIWAAHAVAHVFEMRDEPDAGLRWLAERSIAFAGCNNLTFHLDWHRALFH